MEDYRNQNPPFHIPRSKSPDDLHFDPKPMVGWFTPAELVRAGAMDLLSTLFGAYADRRETQAALTGGAQATDQIFDDYADEEELWFDYVADLADGFSPTYSIARLMADEELRLGSGENGHTTRRGRFVVMGGDEVYPTASHDNYRHRFCGPYGAALPYVEDEERAPGIFALPGNHDWYDGLTAFTRLFCQPGRWIGGWKTRQKRSYFALDLGKDWWLWGVDFQMSAEIDQPQLDFFEQVAQRMPAGQGKIVLCIAEPLWAFHAMEGPESYRNLEYFERRIIRRHGHEVRLGLSGDLHTYARYQDEDGRRHRFIAGGGGAYLYPTHDLPEALELPALENEKSDADASNFDHSEVKHHRYQRDAVYPDVETSRRIARGALLFPFKNWELSALLGMFYLAYSWIVQSVSKMLAGPGGDTFLETLAKQKPDFGGLGWVIPEFWANLAHSPFAVLVLAVLVAGLYGFADADKAWLKIVLGGIHGLAHIVLLLMLMWGFAYFNLDLLAGLVGQWIDISNVNSLWYVALFSAEMYVIGSALGGSLMGLYLFLVNRLTGRHSNEVFLCQSIPHYKHFLRIRRGADGALTLYPIAIDKVPNRRTGWRYVREQAIRGKSWFEPAEGPPLAERAHLIEPPIRLED